MGVRSVTIFVKGYELNEFAVEIIDVDGNIFYQISGFPIAELIKLFSSTLLEPSEYEVYKCNLILNGYKSYYYEGGN